MTAKKQEKKTCICFNISFKHFKIDQHVGFMKKVKWIWVKWIEVSFFLCFAHVSLSNWFPTIQITNCPNIAVYLYSFLALFGHFLTKLYNKDIYYIEDITRRCEDINFIVFTTRRLNSYLQTAVLMFCLLYSRKQFKTQLSNTNFRSMMVKTWLYFN